MSLAGTETEKNLAISFAGESQARNRYTYFANKAEKEGYHQIASIFLETADNEKEHAKRFMKYLAGSSIEIKTSVPVCKVQTTLLNLKAAAAGETQEYTVDYPAFASKADEEGFHDIASTFRNIAVAEEAHAKRYAFFAKKIEEDSLWSSNKVVTWKCRNCGFIFRGAQPPEKCPACQHERQYFEIQEEIY